MAFRATVRAPGSGALRASRSCCGARGPLFTAIKRAAYSGQGTRRLRLEEVGGEFGQFGALAFLEFDMGGDGLLAKFADDVIETVGGRVHVGIINLIGIAREDDFG